MRRSWTSVLPLAMALLLQSGCDRREEPAASSSPPLPTSSAKPPPPTTVASATAKAPPKPSREPDWGLAADDPARDYVTRYIRGTKRYGTGGCVEVKPSTFTKGKDVVETQNDASGACGKAGELRDRFLVSVATDRMSLDESLHQPKLQRWPDGSDPDGPPGAIAELQDLRTWRTSFRDAFRKLELAPIRVQLYGRGTYPVITIAGWHGPLQRTMSPGELEAPARVLCTANEGEPLGIIAGLDRSVLLRISCPGAGRFDTL